MLDVVEVLRVVCLARNVSLMVEELLEEDKANAVEVSAMVDMGKVEDEEDERLLLAVDASGARSCGDLDVVGPSL